jgi:tetraacyldisaccharide 4'-kinase
MKPSKPKHFIYEFVTNSWYHPQWWNYLLMPISWIFLLLVKLRLFFYRHRFFKTYRFNIPVIVVGNITVGGAGKTPLVIHLVEQLRKRGFRPAVVSRGYGRKKRSVAMVEVNSSAQWVGDEPLLIMQRTLCPVFVANRRELAIQEAIKKTDCNLVICDDGLQYSALHRDVEIVVVDGLRRFGSGMLLPAGPLREPMHRLTEVDFIVNNGDVRENEVSMNLTIQQAFRLKTREAVDLQEYVGKTVHAIAGIGYPKRFFNTLIAMGIKVIPHAMPDHHYYSARDFNFPDDLPIFMTEKDMVKCHAFANDRMIYVTVVTEVPDSFIQQIVDKLPSCSAK